MVSFNRTGTLVLALALGTVPVLAAAAPINVYWTGRNATTINVASVSSNTSTLLATTGNRLQDIDLDPANNTLFYADWGPVGPPGGQGSVNRIQTDGTGNALILGTGDAVHQLDLDFTNNRIYFTRAVSYDDREISRVDMNGANYTQLRTGTGSGTDGWFYSGLAVDYANQDIYWGDIGIVTPAPPADGAVNVMDINGVGPTTLVPHVDGKGRGMALDPVSQTLFYTAHDPQNPTVGGGVFAYDIVNGLETQIIFDTVGYWDIEIDHAAQRIWWTDNSRGQIWSANFDGSSPVVELTNLPDVYGLALSFIPEPSTGVLFAIGLLGLGMRQDRRRRTN